MPQPKERAHYFTYEETPLPMHMLLMQEMPQPKYACREYPSSAARATQYECFSFYKHISRVVIADSQEGDHEAGL